MVPFNLQALINARGGNAAWVSFLNSLTSNLTTPSGTNADLPNEPSLEISGWPARGLSHARRPPSSRGAALRFQ